VPLSVVRWQSFGSPPEAPDVLVVSEGLPASAPEPVELAPVELPFMFAPPVVALPEPLPLLLEPPLLAPDALLPEEELLPDVAPPAPPELPEDWAIAEAARLSASGCCKYFQNHEYHLWLFIIAAIDRRSLHGANHRSGAGLLRYRRHPPVCAPTYETPVGRLEIGGQVGPVTPKPRAHVRCAASLPAFFVALTICAPRAGP
jgi:hypothetical protein